MYEWEGLVRRNTHMKECPICHCLQVMSKVKVFVMDDADDDNDDDTGAMTIAPRTLSLGLSLRLLHEKTTREIIINLIVKLTFCCAIFKLKFVTCTSIFLERLLCKITPPGECFTG